jgi:hypothetical protein
MAGSPGSLEACKYEKAQRAIFELFREGVLYLVVVSGLYTPRGRVKSTAEFDSHTLRCLYLAVSGLYAC